MSSGSVDERLGWSETSVRVSDVADAVARLNGEHFKHDHPHAATRALNLIVAPTRGDAEREVVERLESLGTHHPSRTIVLREHAAERLDAEVTIDCQMSPRPGAVGVCHDRVALIADRQRLEHADSLVAPLLMSGLPTCVWLPEVNGGPAAAPLMTVADYVVLDSSAAEPAASLQHAAVAAGVTKVHDLAWGRLSWWRARIAAAFDPPAPRKLLARVDRLDVRYAGTRAASALLLAGWIVARAGWEIVALSDEGDARWAGSARGRNGSVAGLALEPDPAALGCGGVEGLTFRAGEEPLGLDRGPTSDLSRDVFAEALGPLDSYARGYGAALDALAGALPTA